MSEAPTLNFGKHKGRSVNAVPVDYLVWLIDEGFISDNLNSQYKDRAAVAQWLADHRDFLAGDADPPEAWLEPPADDPAPDPAPPRTLHDPRPRRAEAIASLQDLRAQLAPPTE